MNSSLTVAIACIMLTACTLKKEEVQALENPGIQYQPEECYSLSAWVCDGDRRSSGALYVCVVSTLPEVFPSEARLAVAYPGAVTVDPGGRSGTLGVLVAGYVGYQDGPVYLDGFRFPGVRYEFEHTPCCAERDPVLDLTFSVTLQRQCSVHIAQWAIALQYCTNDCSSTH